MTPEFIETYPAISEPVAVRHGEEQARAYAIMREVALKHGIPSAHVMGAFRDRPTAAARRNAMRCIRDELAWSTPQIGRFFDRHHSTVCYALGTLSKSKHAA